MVPAVLSWFLFSVTTRAQKDEDDNEEEHGDSGQTSPQDDLRLTAAAQHTAWGSHGRDRKGHR